MKKFYITTPIYYPTAKPHLGTAYTTIAADILTRWHKLIEEDVFFLTGTDEHGEKLAEVAKKSGKSPKEYVDKLVIEFKDVWKKLNINYDRFIRTTDKDHEKVVYEFIEKIKKDIYKGAYEGLYCVDCEAYLTEKDIVNGECPLHPGKKLEKIKEETYFFKLSNYKDKLLELYDKNPDYILPEKRAKEIINRVKEGLKDLSITRSNLKWGLPYPYDKSHVVYVWFDALLNYFTGIGWPDKKYEKYWPADIHLIGKDISWFHCVIWPSMLFSAGIKPAKSIFVHGWWTSKGEKMSKSRGNVVDPIFIINKYGTDALRYFLFRETPFGEDGDFNEEALKARYHNELADKLGNLVSRVCGLLLKNFEGKLGFATVQDELVDQLQLDAIKEEMESLKLDRALASIFSYIDACNIFVQEKKPWEIKDKKELKNIMYSLVESLRIISILLSPFMPETCENINKQFGFKKGKIDDCKFGLTKSINIKKPIILFKKIEK